MQLYCQQHKRELILLISFYEERAMLARDLHELVYLEVCYLNFPIDFFCAFIRDFLSNGYVLHDSECMF